jgi:hypothetical protein
MSSANQARGGSERAWVKKMICERGKPRTISPRLQSVEPKLESSTPTKVPPSSAQALGAPKDSRSVKDSQDKPHAIKAGRGQRGGQLRCELSSFNAKNGVG